MKQRMNIMKNILRTVKHIHQPLIPLIKVHQILIKATQEHNHMLFRMELNNSIQLIIVKINNLVAHNKVIIIIMDGIIQMLTQMMYNNKLTLVIKLIKMFQTLKLLVL